MISLFEKLSDAVEHARDLDDQKKRQVVIWGSAMLMAVVIVVWIFYISFSFVAVTNQPQQQVSFWQSAESIVFSFAATTVRGAHVVYGKFLSLIRTDRTIEIKDTRNF